MLYHNDPPLDEQEEWQHHMGDVPEDQVAPAFDQLFNQWLRLPGLDSDDVQGSYQDLEHYRRFASYPAAPFVDTVPATPPVSPFAAVHREIRAAQDATRRAAGQKRGRAPLTAFMVHQQEIDDPVSGAQSPALGINGTSPRHAAGNAIDNPFRVPAGLVAVQAPVNFAAAIPAAHYSARRPNTLVSPSPQRVSVTHKRNCPRSRLLLEWAVYSGTISVTDDGVRRTAPRLRAPAVVPTLSSRHSTILNSLRLPAHHQL